MNSCLPGPELSTAARRHGCLHLPKPVSQSRHWARSWGHGEHLLRLSAALCSWGALLGATVSPSWASAWWLYIFLFFFTSLQFMQMGLIIEKRKKNSHSMAGYQWRGYCLFKTPYYTFFKGCFSLHWSTLTYLKWIYLTISALLLLRGSYQPTRSQLGYASSRVLSVHFYCMWFDIGNIWCTINFSLSLVGFISWFPRHYWIANGVQGRFNTNKTLFSPRPTPCPSLKDKSWFSSFFKKKI